MNIENTPLTMLESIKDADYYNVDYAVLIEDAPESCVLIMARDQSGGEEVSALMRNAFK